MKKLLALLTLCLVVFVIVYRQRIFLRDPLASVMRDGAPVSGTAVLINYSNDILLHDESAGKHRVYIVQNWNKVAAAPTAPLTCLQWLACMVDKDQATTEPIPVGSRGRRTPWEGVTMTNKRVEFVDEDGALVQVKLR